MEINQDFASPCGLYCGVCAIYIAADRDNNDKLKARLVSLYQGNMQGKGALPNRVKLTTGDIRCKGCLSDDRFLHCQQCEIRKCTETKGLEGCHGCDVFPCEHIDDFSMFVGKKVILRAVRYRREVGTEKWIEDEEARYVCTECGNKLFRGAARCNSCKSAVDMD